jgi:hypothetical protein
VDSTTFGKFIFLVVFVVAFYISGKSWRSLLTEERPEFIPKADVAKKAGDEQSLIPLFFQSLMPLYFLAAILLFLLTIAINPNLWTYMIETGIMLRIPLALVSGAWASALFWFIIIRKDLNQMAMIAFSLPPILLFLLGYFDKEIRNTAANLTEVKLPYATISIQKPEEPNKITIVGQNPQPSETDFQRGITMLTNAISRAVSDERNVDLFCQNVRSAQCQNIRGERIYQIIHENGSYLQKLQQLNECLLAYSERFPNGVPIQDKLSEIAVIYETMPDYKSGYIGPADTKLKGKIENLIRLVTDTRESIIESFSAHGDFNKRCNYDVNESDLIKVLSQPKIPTRAGVEAGIMMAAGYPNEGARHLINQDNNFEQSFGEIKSKFPYFLLKQRLLWFQQFSLEHTKDDRKQIERLEQLNTLTNTWLQKVANVSVEQLKSAITNCNKGFPGIEFQGSVTPADREEIIRYVARQLWFAIVNRLLEHSAISTLYQDRSYMYFFNHQLNTAKRMWKQAAYDFPGLEHCITRLEGSSIELEEQLKYYRIQMIVNYSKFLYARAASLTRGSDYGQADKEEIGRNLCLAMKSFKDPQADPISLVNKAIRDAQASAELRDTEWPKIYENSRVQILDTYEQLRESIRTWRIDCTNVILSNKA